MVFANSWDRIVLFGIRYSLILRLRILFGIRIFWWTNSIRYSVLVHFHERIVFGICKYFGPNSTHTFLFKVQMNVYNEYIVILLQITFFTFWCNYQLVTLNVSESEFGFGSYPCLAWLYRALDWDQGGGVIPRSIQSMLLQRCIFSSLIWHCLVKTFNH